MQHNALQEKTTQVKPTLMWSVSQSVQCFNMLLQMTLGLYFLAGPITFLAFGQQQLWWWCRAQTLTQIDHIVVVPSLLIVSKEFLI